MDSCILLTSFVGLGNRLLGFKFDVSQVNKNPYIFKTSSIVLCLDCSAPHRRRDILKPWYTLKPQTVILFKIFSLPVSLPAVIQHDATSSKAIHSSCQIMFQTAAQMEIWWIALHCDTATHHRLALLAVIVVTLFIYFISFFVSFFFPLQLMERIKSQINEINIVSTVCVHWFSTLPVPFLAADLIVQSS